MNIDNPIIIKPFTLQKTCDGWPEQYDVYKGNNQVGYLRLRHGRFTCECPDCDGEMTYVAYPKGDGKFNNDERDYYIKTALNSIKSWLKDKNK